MLICISSAQQRMDLEMAIVTNDLYRNLGIGFLLGTIGLVLSNPALLTTLV